MKKILLVAIFCLVAFYGKSQTSKFKVFNAMLYKGMPNLNNYGIFNLDVVYELELLSVDKVEPLNRKKRFIDYPKIKNRVKPNKFNSNYVCLDVENWNTRIRQGGHQAKSNYLEVLNYVKSINSSNKFGFFGVVPFPHYIEEYHKGKRVNHKLLNDWKENNTFLKDIYNKVDVYFPVLYTSSKDLVLYENLVKSQVEIIRLHNKSKPIYGFVWPQYYNPKNKQINYQFIDGDVWGQQLEILKKYCDGIVIWGAPKDLNKKVINWDNNAGWWVATQKFMKKYNLN